MPEQRHFNAVRRIIYGLVLSAGLAAAIMKGVAWYDNRTKAEARRELIEFSKSLSRPLYFERCGKDEATYWLRPMQVRLES